MTERSTEALVEALAADAKPVRPMPSPLTRALRTLAVLAGFGALAVYFLADLPAVLAAHSGREGMLALETAAMLATGVIAVVGAFFLSVPGRSRLWLVAPLPTFAAWLLLSGIGCYGDFLRTGETGWTRTHDADCLIFIIAASLLLGAPLLWRLSRAHPIDPLPVALLGGLGVAALAAFGLAFFHPFAVTFLDLGFHLAAIALVIGAAALLHRRALAAG